MEPLLNISGLTVGIDSADGLILPVQNVDLTINPGETLGLVGESGCGKSMTTLAILRLLPTRGHIMSGSIYFEETDLRNADRKQLQNVRGNRIGLVIQDALSALNPARRIGGQVGELLIQHHKLDRGAAKKQVLEMLERVQLANPERVYSLYPHELSGGQRQRVLIAAALICKPALLIADEPTSALDAPIQRQILDLLVELRKEFGLSVLLISHDLTIVSEVADRIAIMYAGRIVEQGRSDVVLEEPLHPYTQMLLASLPGFGKRITFPDSEKISIRGSVADITNIPTGCAFHPRCWIADARCQSEMPGNTEIAGRFVKCLKREQR